LSIAFRYTAGDYQPGSLDRLVSAHG